MQVLEWVAHSVYSPDDMRRDAELDPSDVPPRFVVTTLLQAPPPALQGLRRYAGAPCQIRCKMPTWMPAVYAAVDSTLRFNQDFIEVITQEMQDYVGSVGVNAHMRSVVQAAAKCVDWEVVLRRPPQHEHTEALVNLYKALRPTLQYTAWPDRERFPHVDPVWPAPRTMLQQYYRC